MRQKRCDGLVPEAVAGQFVDLSPAAVEETCRRAAVKMAAQRSERDVQDHGCRVVGHIVLEHKHAGARAAVVAGCVRAIVSGLEFFGDDALLQASGCFALHAVLQFGGEDAFEAAREADAPRALCAALSHCPLSAAVLQKACSALACFFAAGGEAAARLGVRVGAPGALADTLRDSSRQIGLLEAACDAVVHMLSSCDSLAIRVSIDTGMARALAWTVRENRKSDGVVERGIAALLPFVKHGQGDVIRAVLPLTFLKAFTRSPCLSRLTRRSARALAAALSVGSEFKSVGSGCFGSCSPRSFSRSQGDRSSLHAHSVSQCDRSGFLDDSLGDWDPSSDGEGSDGGTATDLVSASGIRVIESSSDACLTSFSTTASSFRRSRRPKDAGVVVVSECGKGADHPAISSPRLQEASQAQLPLHTAVLDGACTSASTGIKEYRICVSDGHRSWSVQRRFSEFRKLARRFGCLGAMPSKEFLTVRWVQCCRRDFQERRQLGLETLLDSLLDGDRRLEMPALRKFLAVPSKKMHATSVRAKVAGPGLPSRKGVSLTHDEIHQLLTGTAVERAPSAERGACLQEQHSSPSSLMNGVSGFSECFSEAPVKTSSPSLGCSPCSKACYDLNLEALKDAK